MNIDFTTSAKDLFKLKLQGETLEFGLIGDCDYPDMLRCAIDCKLLEFYYQRDHRAILARFKVLEDFSFSMNDITSRSYRTREIELQKHHWLEFTTMLMPSDYTVDRGSEHYFNNLHQIHVDCSTRPEESQAKYREYDLAT